METSWSSSQGTSNTIDIRGGKKNYDNDNYDNDHADDDNIDDFDEDHGNCNVFSLSYRTFNRVGMRGPKNFNDDDDENNDWDDDDDDNNDWDDDDDDKNDDDDYNDDFFNKLFCRTLIFENPI